MNQNDGITTQYPIELVNQIDVCLHIMKYVVWEILN